jgi:glucose/arabinose dehydrogenase
LDTVRPSPTGEAFPAWKGDLVAGGLAGQTVERLRIAGETVVEREELIHGMGRVRDVVTGPDGSIYVVLNQPDEVIRLVPAD